MDIRIVNYPFWASLEAFSRSLPPLRSFARTVGPPLAAWASVAVTPVSRQIWWVQVVDARPQARLHSCEGRSPSLVLVQICRILFAGTSRRSLATWPKRPSLRLRTTTRRRTGRYDAGLPRWIRSRAIWCAGCVVVTVRTWSQPVILIPNINIMDVTCL